ncbi:MAG: PhzF family phenazine biosynthesis protein, partial [Lachnospiraceae bacterium]|nr:PhzF family phenazine biosynthesis protein [Lachnospiraceae bacterium]
APYWSSKLKKQEIVAYQASKRGGTLYCRIEGNKVFLAGRAVLFAVSEINIDEE